MNANRISGEARKTEMSRAAWGIWAIPILVLD